MYEKVFNVIFHTGFIQRNWLIGNIKPTRIYKNKGDRNDPKNFWPIAILSCMGKLFTAVLNTRIKQFCEDFEILKENQTGFRSGYSTTENIFTLHTFFEILKSKRKNLYCAFIDFKSAFDTVWRDGLWFKLLENHINGKMYNIIFNLYKDIKSNIVYNGATSDFFQSCTGVRQGEN